MKLFGIEAPDLLKGVKYTGLCEIKTEEDIYTAFGKVSRFCNVWEKKYKIYANKKGIEVNEKASLAFTHRKFKENIDKDTFEKLENIIEIRTYFEHEFLYGIFEEKRGEQNVIDFDKIKADVDLCYYLICEAIDYIDNLLDDLDISSGVYHVKRTTIFDK